MYFANAPLIPAAANAWRTVHGSDRAALAPTPYFRKFRLVIMVFLSLLFHFTTADDIGRQTPRLRWICQTLTIFCGRYWIRVWDFRRPTALEVVIANNMIARLRIFTEMGRGLLTGRCVRAVCVITSRSHGKQRGIT